MCLPLALELLPVQGSVVPLWALACQLLVFAAIASIPAEWATRTVDTIKSRPRFVARWMADDHSGLQPCLAFSIWQG